jgi:8-oxo-dGTP pyrophosphatase MutT (NUDIX family)
MEKSISHGSEPCESVAGASGQCARVSRYGGDLPDLDHIRARLDGFRPGRIDVSDHRQAAVALVLRERDRQVEILFIERSTRQGDPWSGHMAFPGGRVEPVDVDTRAAAERETLEEVGVSLDGAEYLGPLGDLQGNPRFRQHRLVVTAHIYHAPDPGPFVLQQREVADALWFPLKRILDSDRHVAYRSAHAADVEFPGIEVGGPRSQIVWGLTYRFIDIFMGAIEHPLPDRRDPARFDRLRGRG